MEAASLPSTQPTAGVSAALFASTHNPVSSQPYFQLHVLGGSPEPRVSVTGLALWEVGQESPGGLRQCHSPGGRLGKCMAGKPSAVSLALFRRGPWL